MDKSAYDFKNIVWPIISSKIGGGRIVPVETVTDESFTKELDMYAGIDSWQVDDNKSCIRGIASRVQWYNPSWSSPYPFNTFTIRYRTKTGRLAEYSKKMLAYKNIETKGYLFPAITIQAYMDKPRGNLWSWGAIYTRVLYSYIDKYGYEAEVPVLGGNSMVIVSWSKIKKQGYKVVWDQLMPSTSGEGH